MKKGKHLLLSLLILLLLTEHVSADYEKVSLQLKWKHAFQFAGFYMAKEKGFYRDAGLDVEIREVSADTSLSDEVIFGRANYGVSDSALVQAKLAGAPVVALSAILQHSPLALMTLKSSGIDTPEKLRGKRIMMFDEEKNASLNSMLKSQNVHDGDFQKIPHSFSIKELINKTTDAYEVYFTDQPHQLEILNIKYHLLKPKEYGFDFYGDILFTSQNELTQHPQRTLAFNNASLKGWRYAFSNIDEAILLIKDKYNTQQLSTEQLRFEAKNLKNISGISSGNFSKITKRRIDEIANIYRLMEQFPQSSSLDDFIFQEGNAYLTLQEKQFIATHEINIITTDNWAPFNTKNDNGEIEGIAVDYWSLIQERTGLKSNYQAASFIEVLSAIKMKTSDITISTSMTDDRKKYALFSNPYASFPIAFATTNDKGFISSGSELEGKTLAVGNGYSAHKLLKKHLPDIGYLPQQNTDVALEQVSRSRAFAAADILPVMAFKIGDLGYSNIKISGTTDFDFDVRIMVRDDWHLLISIINKGIAAISEQEKRQIYSKWVGVKYEKGMDYSILWKVGGSFVLILFIAYLWNMSLKREIARRIRAEAELKVIATTDKLTSIANRFQIETLLEQQISFFRRHGTAFSLFFIDLDDFKHINDNFGHQMGDIILKEFASLVQSNIRRIDMFGRWGGEEFIIILPATNLDQGALLAKKLRQIVDDYRFSHAGQVTCSIGLAQIGSDDTAQSLLERADEALYRAKAKGKNCIEISS